jgi:hypothetical protein
MPQQEQPTGKNSDLLEENSSKPEIVRIGRIIDVTLGDKQRYTDPPNKWSDRDD